MVGDNRGKVGFGIGKARSVPDAIRKAIDAARKNMSRVSMVGTTIPHEIVGRHGAAKVLLRPASPGTGVIAGGAMRSVFEVVGVENVLAKSIGSTNPINIVRATIRGLSDMFSPESVAAKRGKSVAEITE